MCSLDRIYAMLTLERNNQADRSGIPAHQSHGAFTRGRLDFAPAQRSRASVRGYFSRLSRLGHCGQRDPVVSAAIIH